MKFTNIEWEIILHRLGAPDAIAEVLFDSELSTYEEAHKRAMELQAHGPDNINPDSKLDMDILEDCCDGCTFFNGIHDALSHKELTKGKLMAYYKAAKSIEEKTGWDVTREYAN